MTNRFSIENAVIVLYATQETGSIDWITPARLCVEKARYSSLIIPGNIRRKVLEFIDLVNRGEDHRQGVALAKSIEAIIELLNSHRHLFESPAVRGLEGRLTLESPGKAIKMTVYVE